MSIYKNAQNDTCVLDEPAEGFVEITQEELDSILSSRKIASDPKDDIRAQISALLYANGLMQEWQVESAMAGMLGYAATLGIDEPTLYSTNPGYKAAKDLHGQIAALRAQL